MSRETFNSGAVRSELKEDWDSISYEGLRRLAQTCAEGNKKYGRFNWEKGIPITNLLSHASKHIFQYLDGNRGEDHLAHAAWGLMAAMHMESNLPKMREGLRPEHKISGMMKADEGLRPEHKISDMMKANEDDFSERPSPKIQMSITPSRPTSKRYVPAILIEVLSGDTGALSKGFSSDAGIDLPIVRSTHINPGDSKDISVGVNIKIPDGYWGSIKARSSTIMKKGLTIMEGVIDPGYTGELSVVVFNPTDKIKYVDKGDRLAQLILIKKHETTIKYVDEMPKTDRGKLGFGSSGK